MRQSVWTKKNRHKAGFLELRTGSARQAHGGVAEVGPLVHRTGVKLGILVAENFMHHEPGARGQVAGVAVGGRRRGVADIEVVEDLLVVGRAHEHGRAMIILDDGVDRERLGAGQMARRLVDRLLGNAQVLGGGAGVDELLGAALLAFLDIIQTGQQRLVFARGFPVTHFLGRGLDAHRIAGIDPGVGTAVEDGDLIGGHAEIAHLEVQASAAVHCEHGVAGRHDDVRLAAVHACRVHDLGEVFSSRHHGLELDAVDRALFTNVVEVHQISARDMAAALFHKMVFAHDRLFVIGFHAAAATNIDDGDVALVRLQPLGRDQRARHVHGESGVGCAHSNGGCDQGFGKFHLAPHEVGFFADLSSQRWIVAAPTDRSARHCMRHPQPGSARAVRHSVDACFQRSGETNETPLQDVSRSLFFSSALRCRERSTTVHSLLDGAASSGVQPHHA